MSGSGASLQFYSSFALSLSVRQKYTDKKDFLALDLNLLLKNPIRQGGLGVGGGDFRGLSKPTIVAALAQGK